MTPEPAEPTPDGHGGRALPDDDYTRAVAWLYGRQALGIKLGLDKMDRLLRAIGDPQRHLRIIHVAGTNGKGSFVAMMESILRNAGFRVGTTTSPHLVRFTERIVAGGRPVPDGLVVRGVAAMRPHVETLDLEGDPPTFFECVTALALWCFHEERVEWALVETGMGGRLDATNVLMPELTAITEIGLDHQEHLGETLGEIAWEKAGIMKPGTPLVTTASGEPLLLLKARSHELQVPMSVVGEDYHVVARDGAFELQTPRGTASYVLGVAGSHQARNGALAVAACHALQRMGVFIPPRAVQEGLRDVRHPGRLERFVHGGAEILVDGAHNPAAGAALQAHVESLGWTDAAWAVGFCADKKWRELLDLWRPRHAWVVPLRNPRSLDPAVAARHVDGTVAGDAASAIAGAVAAGHRRIIVAGSLFLAGEARAFLTGQSLEEIRGTQ